MTNATCADDELSRRAQELYGLAPEHALELEQSLARVADPNDPSKGYLTVGQATVENLIAQYRAGVEDGSIAHDDPRAQLVARLLAAARPLKAHLRKRVLHHQLCAFDRAPSPLDLRQESLFTFTPSPTESETHEYFLHDRF